jgi:hypothetical protein
MEPGGRCSSVPATTLLPSSSKFCWSKAVWPDLKFKTNWLDFKIKIYLTYFQGQKLLLSFF